MAQNGRRALTLGPLKKVTTLLQSPGAGARILKAPSPVPSKGVSSLRDRPTEAHDRMRVRSPGSQSCERGYVSVYLRQCDHRMPESQRHSTFVILPDSMSISKGPHGRGKRFSTSDTT
jgi:hypothetical protein